MAKTILGEYTLVHDGTQFDRTAVAVENFVTPAKLSLSVSIAAETLEGENDRVHPAQMAVKLAMDTLRQSTSDDPHTLILEAFRAANHELYELGRNVHDRLACSMALAFIVDDQMLYMGNLGATRIYLYDPQSGLQKLSVEHTFAQIMTQQRQMSADAALAHPKAATILRSVGTNEDVEADTQFYSLASDDTHGQQIGVRGYPLRAGEAVIVCNSAFYQTSAVTDEPIITDAEVIRTLETHNGVDAARLIVEHAIARQPEDFIAVAILQLPARRASSRTARPSSQGALLWLGALIALVGFGALFLIPHLAQPQTVAPLLSSTSPVQVALVSDNVTDVATPVPPTLSGYQPTPIPTMPMIGSISLLGNSNANPNPLLEGHAIDAPADSGLRVDISSGDLAVKGAQLYMQPLTHMQIDQVTAAQVSATLFKGGDVFIDSGGYRDGVIVHLSGAQDISFSVHGSYMSVQYDANMIIVTCFEGTCIYIDGSNTSHVIPVGQTAYINGDETRFEPITNDQLQRYRNLVDTNNGAPENVNAFLESYNSTPETTGEAQNTEAATAEDTSTTTITPTMTKTEVSGTPTKTRTPTATHTETVTPTETDTPQNGQTATRNAVNASRTPTRTFTPRPTATSQPTATDTDVPPQPTDTDTDVPPQPTATDTDVPPQPTATDTDVPPQPTATYTDVPPQPTATDTDVPPQPTATFTDVPQPPTNTSAPQPTDTPVPPPTDPPPAGTQGS